MTVRSSTILASCAVVALSVAVAPLAHASSAKPEIGYFLSRTDVAVSVAMTLTSCPSEAGELPGIEVEWKVASKGSADPNWPVLIDVSNGFLAKRSNAFEFYPNGTLSGFNGSSEGQAGPLIVSVLKTAAALAPLNRVPKPEAFSPSGRKPVRIPNPNDLYCRATVNDTLDLLSQTKAEIRALEDKVLAHTATSSDLDMLERRRKKRLALIDALTIGAGSKFPTKDVTASWSDTVTLTELLDDWFTPKVAEADPDTIPFDRTKVEGLGGFGVEITEAVTDLADGSPVVRKPPPKEAQRSLFYRRPVLAKVIKTDIACRAPRECKETLKLDALVPIGQWGQVMELPVGKSRLFGSREANASFDQFGTPLKLSYGSDSGAADIGSTIEAAGGAVTAFADADTAALEREIKREELRQKLRELRATAAE